jgi:hypothetical protein
VEVFSFVEKKKEKKKTFWVAGKGEFKRESPLPVLLTEAGTAEDLVLEQSHFKSHTAGVRGRVRGNKIGMFNSGP